LVRRQTAPDVLQFLIPNPEALNKTKELLKNEFPSLEIVKEEMEGNFPLLTLKLASSEENNIRKNAVTQSLEIIRNRIDQFGVSEPVIVRQGDENIVVQLPGVKDPERAIKLIGQTAQLEFKMVDDAASIDLMKLTSDAIQEGRLSADYDSKALNAALRPFLPKDDEAAVMKEKDNKTGKEVKRPILLKAKAVMTGDSIKTAMVQIGGQYNEPFVAMEMNSQGARLFERVTQENTGKRLAIVLDGVVRSAPVIREKIGGGHAQITGSFTPAEASDLAIVLRAGALPAPVQIIQNITVGPSLGKDSIQKGLMAGIIGAAVVMLFMVFYYRLSGLIADVAVMLNILFLMAAMALFHATLTLPGIAGIILTIGMGVDSNVLIFERMREEKALGKPIKALIDGGYDKAFWTIVDAHVTTLITAFALFLFGTGPIKGFAVTLSVGIIINLFTAIFGTRVVYDWMLSKGSIKDISFLQILHGTKIRFIERKNIAFGVSAALCLLGLWAFLQILLGTANLGVDFSGGTMVQYKAEKPFHLDEVRKAVESIHLEGYTLQDVPGENIFILRHKQSSNSVSNVENLVSDALSKTLPDNKFIVESKSEIGSSVSSELKSKAVIAIAISLLGILAYLAFRFDFSFGVAAAIATFHDVILVLGLVYLMNLEISLLIVTALLTLAGYSLTDTVVVFDRIRENIHKHKRLSFAEIINLSVNEMLSRTIIASGTTFMTILALLFFGGVVIRDFALTLFWGVIVGTYSSIFVASPIVYLWHKGKTPMIEAPGPKIVAVHGPINAAPGANSRR
jgi:SecD/SecF fusion protein